MADYSVIERSTTVTAPSAAILALLVDFHEWAKWSPWAELDPNQEEVYSGADSGTGAQYAWSGNRKAGAGTMLITGTAEQSVDIDVTFTRPFKSSSKVRFDVNETDGATDIVWQMRTPKTLGMRIFGLIMNMDKAIGRDLEKGLAGIKRVVEGS